MSIALIQTTPELDGCSDPEIFTKDDIKRAGISFGEYVIYHKGGIMAGYTYIAPGSVAQAAAYQFIVGGYFESNLEKLKALYRPRLVRTLELLDERLSFAQYARPEGGFFVGVTLPEGNDMETLIPAAKAAGLNITNGRGSDARQPGDRREGPRGFLRPFLYLLLVFPPLFVFAFQGFLCFPVSLFLSDL